VAIAVYWGPFPRNWWSDEYRAWAAVFLIPFITSGVVGSVIGGMLGRIVRNKNK